MTNRIYNLCGRVHLGPVCVNCGDKGQPICMACGGNVTREDRDLNQRIWNQVNDLLRKHKAKS